VKNHKALPAGSQPWARDIDTAIAKIAELEGIIRRMVNDFGLDYSNPQRGVNTGSVPSVAKPVQLKLPSLKDLDVRDAVHGDLLMFDATRGVWVARAFDVVELPKVFPVGDPDSYYTPSSATPADTWSTQRTYQNVYTDPAFETSADGWTTSTSTNANTSATASLDPGGMIGQCLKLDFLNTSGSFPSQSTAAEFLGLPLATRIVSGWIQGRDDGRSVRLFLHFIRESGSRNSYGSSAVPAGSGTWHQMFAFGSPDSVPGDPLVNVSATIEISAVTNAGATVYMDEFFVKTGDTNYPNSFNFNGSSPASVDFDYSWDGAPNDSTSTALQRRRIQVPATFQRGIPIQVIGEGFDSGESVTLLLAGEELGIAVADSSGDFDVEMPVDASTATGPSYIEASGSYTYWPLINCTVTE
jgi:hypothetical protein